MLPTSLKYSRSFVLDLFQGSDDDDFDVSISLMPLVYPPFTHEQKESMKRMVEIRNNKNIKEGNSSKIFTLSDVQKNGHEHLNGDGNKLWELSEANIDWSSLPIGFEFSM